MKSNYPRDEESILAASRSFDYENQASKDALRRNGIRKESLTYFYCYLVFSSSRLILSIITILISFQAVNEFRLIHIPLALLQLLVPYRGIACLEILEGKRKLIDKIVAALAFILPPIGIIHAGFLIRHVKGM